MMGEQRDDENTEQPLLMRRVIRSLSNFKQEEKENGKEHSSRVLNTFYGVFIPVALSQFSTTVFLRMGFILGQSGFFQTLIQFMLAYVILIFTVLSICAISTNGALEGGGAYYMISRALGPEFGGSIGLLFCLANVFSCAVYISGFAEGIIDGYGSIDGLEPGHPLPTGQWYEYGYCTVVSLFCLVICMIGAKTYAKTLFVIFGILVVCISSVIISYLVPHSSLVPIPCLNQQYYNKFNGTYCNQTIYSSQNTTELYRFIVYDGMSWGTFQGNLYAKYQGFVDYTNPSSYHANFFSAFAVLFSGVTGIMNGADLSGELKNPAKSLPRGTLLAVSCTFVTYMILTFLAASTTTSELLQNDYNFLKDINLWQPFVYIGIFAATLSAALGNLIAASRVLLALGKDDVFGYFTRPARITTKSGNPCVAVLISWFLVQIVLLIGNMNAIAPLVTVLFLISYASVDLACMALEIASAPNFRPRFKYFNVWTCLLGFVCCILMCFLIDARYTALGIAIAAILVIIIYFRSLSTPWGSVSQALLFHQVRKYLLMIDSRKDHVKFWRPQMLLMVSNPRQSANIIDFINDLKKSGLFILAHVKVGHLDDSSTDHALTEQENWLYLVDYLKVKAFVEVTLARSVREGLQQLARISGLGGMKPNTICLGFYDDTPPKDTFISSQKKNKFGFGTIETEEFITTFNYFHSPRQSEKERSVQLDEYVKMIRDCIKMKKNVCLFRHFNKLDKKAIFKPKAHTYIDVWPANMCVPDNSSYMDNCSLYVLQLACVLNMVKRWKKATTLRVFMCYTDSEDDALEKKKKLKTILEDFRIEAEILPVRWSDVDVYYPVELRGQQLTDTQILPDKYIQGLNELIRKESSESSVVFMYLPLPPKSESEYEEYMRMLTNATEYLPPTVLVHGLSPVTSTTL